MVSIKFGFFLILKIFEFYFKYYFIRKIKGFCLNLFKKIKWGKSVLFFLICNKIFMLIALRDCSFGF